MLFPSLSDAITKIAENTYVDDSKATVTYWTSLASAIVIAGKTLMDLWFKKRADDKQTELDKKIDVLITEFKNIEKKQDAMKDHIDRDVERYVLRYMKEHKT